MLVLINRICYYWPCANVVGLDYTVVPPEPKVVSSTLAARTTFHPFSHANKSFTFISEIVIQQRTLEGASNQWETILKTVLLRGNGSDWLIICRQMFPAGQRWALPHVL